MTRYITEHYKDPERAIRFFRQYCTDWHESNADIIRKFFLKRHDLDVWKYVAIFDDLDSPNISCNIDDLDTYVKFEDVKGRRCL